MMLDWLRTKLVDDDDDDDDDDDVINSTKTQGMYR